MCLMLGPPGSGKSSLLKILAGKVKDSKLVKVCYCDYVHCILTGLQHRSSACCICMNSRSKLLLCQGTLWQTHQSYALLIDHHTSFFGLAGVHISSDHQTVHHLPVSYQGGYKLQVAAWSQLLRSQLIARCCMIWCKLVLPDNAQPAFRCTARYCTMARPSMTSLWRGVPGMWSRQTSTTHP